MDTDTRQTLIGVVGLSTVESVALLEGFNGFVLTAYFASVVALIAPQALDSLPFQTGGS